MVFVQSDPSTSAAFRGADDAYRSYRDQSHFGSLDGLRFLCIAAVIWHHGPWWPTMETPAAVLQRGFVGVDFFFVLSGYLITTLLLREEHLRGRFSLKGFYWRRALRILPIYFFVVTLAAGYFIVVKGQWELLELLPYYYLFLSNFLTTHIPLLGPTWSLAVEEQYYLIWPLLLLFLPRRIILPVLFVFIAANVLGVMGVFGVEARTLGPLTFSLPNATYAPILMGSALAVMLDRQGIFAMFWPILRARSAVIVVFALIPVLLQILPDDLRGWPNFVLHLTMTVALAGIVVREDHPLAQFFKSRPIARVGEVSYGIYLYHLIALHIATVAFEKIGLNGALPILLGYAALSVAMAEISDRTLERFFRSFRQRGPGRGG